MNYNVASSWPMNWTEALYSIALHIWPEPQALRCMCAAQSALLNAETMHVGPPRLSHDTRALGTRAHEHTASLGGCKKQSMDDSCLTGRLCAAWLKHIRCWKNGLHQYTMLESTNAMAHSPVPYLIKFSRPLNAKVGALMSHTKRLVEEKNFPLAKHTI